EAGGDIFAEAGHLNIIGHTGLLETIGQIAAETTGSKADKADCGILTDYMGYRAKEDIMGFFAAESSGDANDYMGIIIAKLATHGFTDMRGGVEAMGVNGAGNSDEIIFVNIAFF